MWGDTIECITTSFPGWTPVTVWSIAVGIDVNSHANEGCTRTKVATPPLLRVRRTLDRIRPLYNRVSI